MELIGVPHDVAGNEYCVIKGDHAHILNELVNSFKTETKQSQSFTNSVDYLNSFFSIKIMDKNLSVKYFIWIK